MELEINQEVTEKEIIESMSRLARLSVMAIGMDQTKKNLDFLSGIIESNPEKYKSVFRPENMEEIGKVLDSGISLSNPLELVGMIGKLKKILQ